MSDEIDLNLGFGQIIRNMRRKRDMTQKDLADLVGLERTSITNIERGNQRVSLDMLGKFASALHLHITLDVKELAPPKPEPKKKLRVLVEVGAATKKENEE